MSKLHPRSFPREPFNASEKVVMATRLSFRSTMIHASWRSLFKRKLLRTNDCFHIKICVKRIYNLLSYILSFLSFLFFSLCKYDDISRKHKNITSLYDECHFLAKSCFSYFNIREHLIIIFFFAIFLTQLLSISSKVQHVEM